MENRKNFFLLLSMVILAGLCRHVPVAALAQAAGAASREAASPGSSPEPVNMAQAVPLNQSLETRIALIERDVSDLKKRQEQVESCWPVKLGRTIDVWQAAGGLVVVLLIIRFFTPRWLKRILKEGKERLDEEIIDKIFASDKARLTTFFEEQNKENRRRILARDKKIHFVPHGDSSHTDAGKDLGRLKNFLDQLGFKNLNASLEEADLVVVVGKEACENNVDQLAGNLRGRLVPVVFFFGSGRMDPDPVPKFELATLANSLSTTIVHIHNLAMLVDDPPARSG